MPCKPKITDDQWKAISKHLPESNAYASDRQCFDALIDSIWSSRAIRERSKEDRHPGYSTLVARTKLWQRKKKLPYMIQTFSKFLSDEQREKLRKKLLKKTGWAGVFIDNIKPAKSGRK